MNARLYLAGSLLAMAAFFVAWFARDAHLLTGLLVFALPPTALAVAAFLRVPRAGFISAVLALLWFSHGVMLAWAEPTRRWSALLEALLALVIIHAACLPGMRARREGKSFRG